MRSSLTIAALLALLWFGTQAAGAQERHVEQAVETTTNLIILPNSIPGRLTVRSCETCTLRSFDFPSSAKLYIADREVTLQEFVLETGRDTRRGAVVLYRDDLKSVTRVVASRE